jgi:hypothetical protein
VRLTGRASASRRSSRRTVLHDSGRPVRTLGQQRLRERADERRRLEQSFHQRKSELKRGRPLDLERRALVELPVLESAARHGEVSVRADFYPKPRYDWRLIGRDDICDVACAGRDPFRAGHTLRLCHVGQNATRLAVGLVQTLDDVTLGSPAGGPSAGSPSAACNTSPSRIRDEQECSSGKTSGADGDRDFRARFGQSRSP